MTEIERFFAEMKRAAEAERKRQQQEVQTYPLVLVGYCECAVCDQLFLRCEEAAFLAETGRQMWQ